MCDHVVTMVIRGTAGDKRSRAGCGRSATPSGSLVRVGLPGTGLSRARDSPANGEGLQLLSLLLCLRTLPPVRGASKGVATRRRPTACSVVFDIEQNHRSCDRLVLFDF